ncbi:MULTISPECIES: hypothetical protein [unclassified Sphingobium]|uniref:hypothetical protein n=1 Tax=unclassified Sphingobium TaxID=2611147 RepID=UPI00119BEB6C|nr:MULTISPECIES: hypothetical protein [unclassified Sphingobium]MBG6119016.1 hypothetical protein [Sphingobium sp. JAI105]TWC96271.1 D-mannose binding lectin [Sphingobium sp. AEW010]TWD16107.1 D-mannose binding lectin [Sphingobium sp. AEW013]TWD19197.1 D-mannose binding lectin [Sphingobium sp. AEW001]
MRYLIASSIGLVAALAASSASFAQNTDSYDYDALGRLVNRCSATWDHGFRQSYALDSAENRTNVLASDEGRGLLPGGSFTSSDGRFTFTMQADGNLVLRGPSGVLWHTGTYDTSGAFLAFQGDGKLVVYKGDGTGAIWQSGSYSLCSRLIVQNDGNVVIYATSGQAIWATNTGGN